MVVALSLPRVFNKERPMFTGFRMGIGMEIATFFWDSFVSAFVAC